MDDPMSLAELLPSVQALPRAEKLRLAQMLIVDLAREEGVPLIEADRTYPIWTPYHAHEAAAALLRFLESQRAAS
jgi:hypothetical protein